MIITYHNIQFFKVQQGDTVIAFNPISKKSKFKGPRFGADLVLISSNSVDFNGVENVTSKNKELFVIDSPGEYEVRGVFVKGSISGSKYKEKERINTVYSLILDGTKIGFLGALGSSELDDKAKAILSEIDILFVPIGNEGTLNPADANKLATKLGAKIIIPMHYGDVGEKDALKTFLKESGSEDVKAIDKLTIKKKDIAEKQGEVVVLKSNT